MARLPVPGSDNGVWGNILNDFLSIEHNADGTLKVRTDLAGKVDKATVTTKGDLLVGTAASTVSRLGAGSNGQYLIVDGGQTAGMRWVDDTVVRVEYYGVTADGTTDDSAS